MEGTQLMDWLRSRWDWIVRNKVLTGVIVFAVGLLVFVVVMVCRHWGWIVTESGSTIIRNLGLVIGGFIAIGFGIWRGVVAGRQAKTSQRGLLNERYQRGAEMLGSPVLAVRLGGIYALERLADDEPELYHVQIVCLFSAFACDPIKKGGDEIALGDSGGQLDIKNSCEDVQEAVRAIGNRSANDIELEEKKPHTINLIGVNLTRANLTGVNLTGVFLGAANLTKASLAIANLTGAHLSEAYLGGTILGYTNLSGANLSSVKGLTQEQLDLARADPANPPKLGNLRDAETGAPLEWRGKPCGE